MTEPRESSFSVRSSSEEKARRNEFARLFTESPIPQDELVYSQLSVYLSRQELSRLLAISDLYQRHVLSTNGIIIEFGTCYGRTAATLLNLRSIFEPYNFTRRLVVFDTFAGLVGTTIADGSNALAVDGAYSTPPGYDQHLQEVLAHHEAEAPIAHLRKFELVKGDAASTLPEYLSTHPEAIVAMAYFDFDIYQPTKAALTSLLPRLCRNSLLIFDELNCPEYPGETAAVMEVFGLGKLELKRSPLTPWMSYSTCENLF